MILNSSDRKKAVTKKTLADAADDWAFFALMYVPAVPVTESSREAALRIEKHYWAKAKKIGMRKSSGVSAGQWRDACVDALTRLIPTTRFS